MYDAADGCGRGIRVGLVRECARTGHRDPESLAGVYAISVILNSSLQVALALTPALVLISFLISPTI